MLIHNRTDEIDTSLTLKQPKVTTKIKPHKDQNQWNDWKWQLKNRITSPKQLIGHIPLKCDEVEQIQNAANVFPMAITPYYASLISSTDRNCPIRRQAIPDPGELITRDYEMADPLHEDKDSPVPGLTHRYPDRVLLMVTNECSMYCRHCTRKRKVGDEQEIVNISNIEMGINYIKENPAIRDVLISGGDPFLLETSLLEKIIQKVREIPHVEVIRIGTRTPVVLPQRITQELVDMLKKYHPIWVNTHFNHPKEMTPEAEKALAIIADAGIPMGNQSVLLRKVNDCSEVMKRLVHLLVKNRVRPYYIYQCDLSRGIEHFRTPISTGIEIMERLIGHTSGFSVPRYIVDAPGGGGKIPVLPNYIISHCQSKVVLRNYEGVITVYQEPSEIPQQFEGCPDKCNLCGRLGNVQNNSLPIGLEKLLDNETEDISLIPQGNTREGRFKIKEENCQQELMDTLKTYPSLEQTFCSRQKL